MNNLEKIVAEYISLNRNGEKHPRLDCGPELIIAEWVAKVFLYRPNTTEKQIARYRLHIQHYYNVMFAHVGRTTNPNNRYALIDGTVYSTHEEFPWSGDNYGHNAPFPYILASPEKYEFPSQEEMEAKEEKHYLDMEKWLDTNMK